MQKLYLNANFMQDLYHSGVKTEHSLIDYVSIKDLKDNEFADKIQQFKQVLKWVKKQSALSNYEPIQPSKKPISQYGFYLVKIESLNNLFFKKIYSSSKIYATIIGKLISIKSNRFYPKVNQIIRVVEQTNTYTYELKEPILFYFYTSTQNQVVFNLEVLLSEHQEKPQALAPVFGAYENAGSVHIDLTKERKGKQRKLLIPPNEYLQAYKQGEGSNVSPFANFLVTKSDAYRYLEKIIPQNTICDPADRIAGILGNVLPLSQNALTDFALTPDAQGLALSLFSVEINSNLLRDSSSKAQNIMKNRYSTVSKVTSNIKDVLLHVYFHNGWKAVSEKSSVLKEKGDFHLKTNQSNFSELPNKKTQPGKTYQNPIKLKNQFKRYDCEQQIELKLVFPQEEECVLIYQIIVDVNVRGEIESNQKKELPDLLQQNIAIPLCFAISSAKSIANERHIASSFSLGGCLNSFQPLRQLIELNIKNLTHMKKNQSKIISQSKNKIPSALMEIDAVSNNKTIDNISHMSTKKFQNQIGFIDLQMRLIDKQHFQTDTNMSLPLQNMSSFNVSKMDIKDKIQNEKQRITKQTKKNLTIIKANKLNIDFLRQMIMSQNQKQQISKVINIKKSKYYQKQAFAKLLKQQIDKHYMNKQLSGNKNYLNNTPAPAHKSKHQITKSFSQQYQTRRVLYSMKMSKIQPQSICEHRYSKYFYYLFSNRIIQQKYYFKYQAVPLDIIKTQLSQINYNNCYFINFIQISNYTNNTVVIFPHVFYFKIQFYNQQQIRSELMTINKDTGQILLLNNQNSSTKIIHIEVNIDDQPNNFVLKFSQFIEFMYNGMVNVQVMDYFTGLSYGNITIPLRNLIRKRRNQVIYIHEDLIHHRNTPKANIKVELRAIRKMKHQIKAQSILPEKKKEQSPVKNVVAKEEIETDLRMQRIQRFKENRNKDVKIGQQSQLHTQNSKINKMVSKAYTHQSTKLMVTYLKKQFFFLEVNNKNDTNAIYRISITDEDKKWIQSNPLSGNDQITIVKDPSKLEKEDYQILTSHKKNQEKMLKCLQINEEDQLSIVPRGKGYLLLCYLTVRKYKEWQNGNSNSEQLAIFNRERTISLSLINESKGSIEVIYAIQIIPIPEDSIIQLQYYRPANQQSLIHLPFIDSQYLHAKIDQILIDDPYVLVLPAANNSLPLIKKFTAVSTGIYIQLSNDIPLQSFKEFNILILNDVKRKQIVLGESRKNQKGKSRTKIQSRMVEVNDEFDGPKLIRINMRVWGCFKIEAQVTLWVQKQGAFELNNQIFKKKDIKHFYLASDNQQSLKLYQNKKQKHQNHQLFVVEEGVKTQISYSLCSNIPNTSFIYVHVIGATQAFEQEESLKSKRFTYIQPLFRIVMQIESIIPNFKQMLRININKTSQGVIEQPFTYKSNSNKKTQFKIYSSDATIVWAKNNDSIFQLQAKAQRKLHINFNTQKIIERSILCGGCEGIVLGIKWDKGIDYYGFKFNIY